MGFRGLRPCNALERSPCPPRCVMQFLCGYHTNVFLRIVERGHDPDAKPRNYNPPNARQIASERLPKIDPASLMSTLVMKTRRSPQETSHSDHARNIISQ